MLDPDRFNRHWLFTRNSMNRYLFGQLEQIYGYQIENQQYKAAFSGRLVREEFPNNIPLSSLRVALNFFFPTSIPRLFILSIHPFFCSCWLAGGVHPFQSWLARPKIDENIIPYTRTTQHDGRIRE